MPWGGNAEQCKACGKSVYEMEKLTVETIPYHKNCFKCAKCGKVMGVGDFTSIGGESYCLPHFRQLFKIKGNYEDGFKMQLEDSKKAAEAQGVKKSRVAAAPVEPSAPVREPSPEPTRIPTPEPPAEPEPVKEEEEEEEAAEPTPAAAAPEPEPEPEEAEEEEEEEEE